MIQSVTLATAIFLNMNMEKATCTPWKLEWSENNNVIIAFFIA